MKKTFCPDFLKTGVAAILVFCFFQNTYGQSGLCQSGVPFTAIDFTGNPDSSFITSDIIRNNLCCTNTSPDRCIEFSITLDSAAAGINFDIFSGAVPPGALFYQINCGPQVPVGQPICLT